TSAPVPVPSHLSASPARRHQEVVLPRCLHHCSHAPRTDTRSLPCPATRTIAVIRRELAVLRPGGVPSCPTPRRPRLCPVLRPARTPVMPRALTSATPPLPLPVPLPSCPARRRRVAVPPPPPSVMPQSADTGSMPCPAARTRRHRVAALSCCPHPVASRLAHTRPWLISLAATGLPSCSGPSARRPVSSSGSSAPGGSHAPARPRPVPLLPGSPRAVRLTVSLPIPPDDAPVRWSMRSWDSVRPRR